MTVRVRTSHGDEDHDDAVRFEAFVANPDWGTFTLLTLFDREGRQTAAYAPGRWESVARFDDIEPGSQLCITVTLPEALRGKRWAELSVVDRESLEDSVTDALRLVYDRSPLLKPQPEAAFAKGGPVNESAPTVLAEGETVVTTNTTTTAYIEFSPSLDDGLVQLMREAIRTDVDKADEALLRRLRRIVRNKGGLRQAFGEGDDGSAGVREPVGSPR